MVQKVLFLDGKCVNKNAFHSKKRPISINKIEIKRTMLFDKTSCLFWYRLVYVFITLQF